MRILASLAFVTLVGCGGSKHPPKAEPCDTCQVIPGNYGAPGDWEAEDHERQQHRHAPHDAGVPAD